MAKKFLIIHLVANGDCLMVTTIARQIKEDNPGCHVTWAISYTCKQVIENNPFVDRIWEVKYEQSESPFAEVWYKVKQEAQARMLAGEFDQIVSTQMFPDNTYNFDGTTRSSAFRGYNKKITVPVTPVMVLYKEEVDRVKKFAAENELQKYRHVILCECAPGSGQSFLTSGLMIAIAAKIVNDNPDIIFIISTHKKNMTESKQIIDASVLSYRENAELSKYCTLLIGCSSGISWLLTSDWAKKIPAIQFLDNSKKAFQFAGLKYDFKYWGLPHDHIIESSNSDPLMMQTIITTCINNFEEGKKYGEDLFPDLQMLEQFLNNYFKFRQLFKILKAIKNFVVRNKIKWWRYGEILFIMIKGLFQFMAKRILLLAK